MSIILTISVVNKDFIISISSSQGSAEEVFISPYDSGITDEFLDNLETGMFDNEFLKYYGRILYDCLFKGNIKKLFESSLQMVQSSDSIDLKLQFNDDALHLSKLPWELLYDGSRFLVSSGVINLVRHINLPQSTPKTDISLPFHVLVITARPFDEDPLDNIAEQEAIYKGLISLEEDDSVVIDLLKPPTLDALITVLNTGSYDAIHFDGHGAFTDKGYLAFEDEYFQSDLIDVDTIANTLASSSVKLVILSACQSSMVKDNNIFNSIAPSLIQAGISAVVAMQFSIPSDSAERFSKHFYSSLANFDGIGNAVIQGRKVLFQDLSWFIPTLYLGSSSDKLFYKDQDKKKKIKRFKTSDFYVPHKIQYFTGRQRDLIEFAKLMDSTDANIFVVWGSGGIGKTVFASEFVKMQSWRFPHGIFWIDLRGGKSLDAILDEISIKINGITNNQEIGKKIQVVHELLENKNLVIILDNFESVDKDEMIKNFISDIQRPVKVIITSQTHPEILNWKTIQLYKLSLEESKLLFSKMCENMGITFSEDKDIEEICQVLDGYPLSMELIAPLVKSTSVKSLLSELKEKPLEGLELALDTSFDKMGTKEKNMLVNISVFDSYFDENAINALFKDDNWKKIKNELVRRSFLHFNGDNFVLHPVIRQYAYHKLANKKKYHLIAANYLETTGNYFEEVDQLYYAENWKKVVNVMNNLFSPEFMRGLPELTDISKRIETSKKAANKLKDPELEATLESCLGNYYKQVGQYQKAFESYEKAYKYVKNDDIPMKEVILGQISVIYLFLGNYKEAYEKQEECLKLCRKLYSDSQNQIPLANSLANIGDVYSVLSGLSKDKKDLYNKKALDAFEEAKDIINKVADPEIGLLKAQIYTSLGRSYIYSNDLNADKNAKKYLKDGLILKEKINDLYGIPYSLTFFSELYEKLGEYDKAIRCLDEILELSEQINILGMCSNTLARYGQIKFVMGDKKSAIDSYNASCYLSFLEGENIFQQHINIIESHINRLLEKNESKKADELINSIIDFWIGMDGDKKAPELIQRLRIINEKL
jgi:tetratricopeptide (TPR) repeat protein